MSKRFLTGPQLCARYGVTSMTLWRWAKDPAMKFPKPIRINRLRYFDEADIEAWERSRIAMHAKRTKP